MRETESPYGSGGHHPGMGMGGGFVMGGMGMDMMMDEDMEWSSRGGMIRESLFD